MCTRTACTWGSWTGLPPGGIRFGYMDSYLAGGHAPVSFALPLGNAAVETPHGALPAFLAGLLPEGHCLAVLKNATN